LEEAGVILTEVETRGGGYGKLVTASLVLQELLVYPAVPSQVSSEKSTHALHNDYEVLQVIRLAKFL